MSLGYGWVPVAMKLPIGDIGGTVLAIEISATARVLILEKTTQEYRVEFSNGTILTLPATMVRDTEEDAIEEDRRILRTLRNPA